MAHTFEELVEMQRAADEAHAEVLKLRDSYGPPTRDGGWTDEQTATYDQAWHAWRERAAEVQASVTGHAQEQGTARNAVEADVKKAVRHPVTATADS
ncbi:hypothetical protein ACIGMX_34705 [Streptomyces aquilus]|uniref:hypothetical protein n=1 Tax=Streptomyces aquilus TaxID=2548456 RepID=UPI0037D14213